MDISTFWYIYIYTHTHTHTQTDEASVKKVKYFTKYMCF